MKLIGTKPVCNQPGTVKLIPEEPDDLWLAYNIINAGDHITSHTSRKVQNLSSSSRFKLSLQIKITSVHYDRDSTALRVSGKNITGGKNIAAHQHIDVGAFHTLEIQMKQQFDLTKKLWDAIACDALQEGCERLAGADIAVFLMQHGSAHLYSVGNSITTLCSKMEGNSKFFESVFRNFEKHVDFSIVRCVAIGSHGPVNNEFRDYLISEAQRRSLKSIEANKSRIVCVQTNAGTCKDSLREVLSNITVMNMIKDSRAIMEIRGYTELSEMIMSGSDRACYGIKNVEAAQEMRAIDTLLITDDLLRNAENEKRHKFIDLVNSVKKAGGKAMVFSSMHVSGEQLQQWTGIAAILRFPLPDLDYLEL